MFPFTSFSAQSGSAGAAAGGGVETRNQAASKHRRTGDDGSRSDDFQETVLEKLAELGSALGQMNQGMKDLESRFDTILTQKIQEVNTSIDVRLAALEEQGNVARERERAELQREIRTEMTAQAAVFKDEIAKLKGASEQQDRAARAMHMIVKGVPEKPTEPVTVANIGQILPGAEHAATEVRRLGREKETAGALPRPILVKFRSIDAKHAAYKHSKTLRAKKIYLDSDLTPAQREQRTGKRDRYQHLKTQGARPFWREDRLFYYVNGAVKEDSCTPPGPPPPPADVPSGSTPRRQAWSGQAAPRRASP